MPLKGNINEVDKIKNIYILLTKRHKISLFYDWIPNKRKSQSIKKVYIYTLINNLCLNKLKLKSMPLALIARTWLNLNGLLLEKHRVIRVVIHVNMCMNVWFCKCYQIYLLAFRKKKKKILINLLVNLHIACFISGHIWQINLKFFRDRLICVSI